MMKESRTIFPPVYEKVSIDKLLSVYRSAAEKVLYLVSDSGTDILKARPLQNKWSIQEIVFHLLDAELVGLTRMRMLISENAKLLPVYDQDRWAVAMDYNSRTENEVMETIRSFYTLRDNNAIMLESLPSPTWKKTANHPEYGDITLRNLLEIYADHGERHIEQIIQRLQLLGNSRRVVIDLPERLY